MLKKTKAILKFFFLVIFLFPMVLLCNMVYGIWGLHEMADKQYMHYILYTQIL